VDGTYEPLKLDEQLLGHGVDVGVGDGVNVLVGVGVIVGKPTIDLVIS
jgi:opacity protein-like surface antigen